MLYLNPEVCLFSEVWLLPLKHPIYAPVYVSNITIEIIA